MGDSGDTGGHAGGGRGPRLPLLLSLCLLLFLLLLLPASTACPAACSCEAVRQGRGTWPSHSRTPTLWPSPPRVRQGLRDGAAPPPDTNTVAVTCKSAGLKAPPDHLALNGLNSTTVIKLDLSFNNLTELKPRALTPFPALQTLILANNRIKKIAPEAFLGLNLEVLHLEENALTSLVEVELPAGLRELSLEKNHLTALPPSLSSLHSLQTLNVARNRLTVLKDGDLRGLHNLLILSLHYNKITAVEDRAFVRMKRLEILNLEGNALTEVPPVVPHCTKLRQLHLGHNRLSYFGEKALAGLRKLQEVALHFNPLRSIHHRAFSNLPALTKLILKEVKQLQEFPDLNGTNSLEDLRIDRSSLTAVPEDLCSVAPILRSLNLQRNRIMEQPYLNGCRYLRLVDLSYNNISSLRPGGFAGLSFLQDLLLQGNVVTTLHNRTFKGLERLQVLQLEGNLITSIHPEAFMPLHNLEDINLGNNSFPELPHEGLNKVISIKVHNNRYLREFPGPENFPLVRTLTLSYAYHCCPFLRLRDTTEAPKIIEDVVFSVEGLNNLDPTIWNVSSVWPDIGANTEMVATPLDLEETTTTASSYPSLPRHQVLCQPEPGPFMPCEDLFDWWTLRCGVWIVFLLALLGNGTVVVVLIFARSKMDVPRFLVTNLAFADFFMGLYLGFLAVVDASTLGEFRMYAIPWQTSAGCQVAGFLGVLSCELSVYTLTVITMERNYAITHAMHLNKRLSLRHAAYIMVFGWLFASTLALLPLIGVSDYRKFAVCLPIETRGAGLGYVVFLMFINGVAFLILMGCYLKIYCAIRGSQAWNSNDSRIAKRMALLVFTDFICWAPIAFFSLTAAFGLHLISLKEAKVFTVFILPFNSCCNPFLYALLTKQFKKDCVLLCKTIEESRVTRGIGRCRHSSNFSNRQTPANTNSALDNSTRQDNQSCRCQNKTQESQKLHHRLRISALKYMFCHKDTEEMNSASDFSYQPTKSAVKSKRHPSVSSETYSSSWSETWRRGQAVMSMRLDRRLHNSWYLSRKPSQESNLSSSRNDSSATTASTSTWRISRSSVSSDISSSGSRGVGKTDAAPVLRLGSIRDRRGEGPTHIPARQITHHQALLVRQQPGASGQRSGTTTSAVRIKPRLQRQIAVERETYIPSKNGGKPCDIPCPLHPRSDNLSCVYEQDSYEEEEHEHQKDFLSPRCPMTGLTVTFIPRKLSTISSHSVSVVKDADNEESTPPVGTDRHSLCGASPTLKSSSLPRGGKCVSLTLLPQSSVQASSYRFPSDGHLPRSPRHTEFLYFTKLATPALMISHSDQKVYSPVKCEGDGESHHYGQAIISIHQPDDAHQSEQEECMESTALMDDDGCDGDDEVFEEEKETHKRPLETHFPVEEQPGESRPLI
ncbi:leucine-rich repeat-containing G-protein coupled receptor 5-like isoform X3 [Portunus trituberculatus]|uniref:leucine-rich repeat-containing G-protein coupled receptor 5-like isoform X3 n=1 Tax=Portunus trituberculatus TaxID=210409 RepID=UPI001E1CD94A|nr:leucine-rich repeat-containing G-protein coupled receptor 5-like isoform X3 [Portunus trituberculatus]